MEIIAEGVPDHAAPPRRAGGLIDVHWLLRLVAEQPMNAVMNEQAEMLCADRCRHGGHSSPLTRGLRTGASSN